MISDFIDQVNIVIVSRIIVRISANMKYHVGGNFFVMDSQIMSPGNRNKDNINTGNKE